MADNKTKQQEQDIPSASPTPFIDADTAYDAYDESRKWLKPYFEPLDEFERIARNKPSSQIPDELPKVVDGTMAAIVQENPKRIIQQIPTGLVGCKDYAEYAKIADIILTEDLIPMYNRMGDMLQKSWNMVGKAMTWGRSASYTFYTQTNGRLHTDFTIPYAKDVLSEKGKVFAPDSNVAFLRSWYQKRDIQATINREEAWEKNIKGYKSDWDIPALKQWMETGASAKPADQMTPAEREKGGDTGGYELITAFQEGAGAEFYSFAPRFKDSSNGKNLRTKINKDPRGKMPIDFLYCNIDLSNPMGRGQVELSGGVQNLIDQQMQMFQFLTTFLMAPALQVWGKVNKASLKFQPNAIWDMGDNLANNKVEPYAVNNAAIQQFSDNYALLKSQIFNLNNTQDNSISASVGNVSQSKTQAGVQASQARLGVSDNYLRKQYESWFEAQSETSINIYFSEMTGEKTKQLTPQQVKDFEKTEAKKFVDKKGVLTIPYKEINDAVFRFKVDPSTSEVKEDSDNAEKLTEVLKVMEGSQDPSIQQKIPQIIKLIIDEIGAEGTDDLFPELDPNNQDNQGGQAGQQPGAPGAVDPNQIMQMVQQMVQQEMQAQKQAPKPLGESVAWKPGDLTDNERAQALQQVGIQADQQPITPNQQAQDAKTNLDATKTAVDIHKTAHQHTLDMHNAATTASQPQQDPNNPQADQNSSNAGTAPSSTSVDNGQPGQLDHLNAPLRPEEEQIVHALTHQGYGEADIEQAITMLRSNVPTDQIMQVLGAKHARQ